MLCTNTKLGVLYIKKKRSLEHEKHVICSVSTALSRWCKHLRTPQLSERESDVLYLQIMINDAKFILGDFKQKILTVSGGSFIT